MQRCKKTALNGNITMPETICPSTSKLACWRVQLSTTRKVGRRGAGTATASIEASLLAGDISHPPAQMVPFMLADELCRPPIEGLVGAAYTSQPPAQMVPFLLAGGLYRPPTGIFTTGGFHMHPPTQ
jgi:hypothetical protein